MTTISVPLSADLLKALEYLIQTGVASNKADGIRKALKAYAEQQAIEEVLRAAKEPTLYGDLRTLAKKFQ